MADFVADSQFLNCFQHFDYSSEKFEMIACFVLEYLELKVEQIPIFIKSNSIIFFQMLMSIG